MAVVNQKHADRTVWKESSICTKTWNNSVLQFMKVSDMVEADAGFLVRDTVVFVCEILDCCPWFEFSDLEVIDLVGDRTSMSVVEILDLVHCKRHRHQMHSNMWTESCLGIEKLNLLLGTTQNKFTQSNYLQVLISDEEQDALSTDPDELLDSDDSDGISGDEEDIFRSLLARAGFHLSYGDNPPLLLDPSQLQVTLREKLLMDAGAVAAFLAGVFFCS